MKKQRKGMQGITLIALVVTIVVLLILAGVSISMLTGENGIITQAQNSKNKNKQGEIEEQVRLAVMSAKTAGLGAIDFDTLNSELIKIGYNGDPLTKEDLPKDITINGIIVTIDEDTVTSEIIGEPPALPEYAGQTYETETEVTVGTEKVVVPGGVTISGIRGECENVDDGVVIYIIPEGEEVTDWNADSDENGIIDVQETYDQFVWVPVPNAIAVDSNEDGTIDTTDIDEMMAKGQYPMAITTGTTTDSEGNTVTNYRGVLYSFTEKTDDTGNVTVSISDRSWSADTTSYREPAYLDDGTFADPGNYNTVGVTRTSVQTEFNEMVEKVVKNKGFWVGRYETSNMIGTAATKYSDELNEETVEADTTNKVTVIKGTTTGISGNSTIPNYINWYRMYAQQKNYSNLANITSTSSMIWGSQWDQIMIWMKDVDNKSQNSKYIVNSIGMGNFGTSADSDADTSWPVKTGNFENYKVKNVYDLAGNVWDWTLEGCNRGYRIPRRRLFRRYFYFRYTN